MPGIFFDTFKQPPDLTFLTFYYLKKIAVRINKQPVHTLVIIPDLGLVQKFRNFILVEIPVCSAYIAYRESHTFLIIIIFLKIMYYLILNFFYFPENFTPPEKIQKSCEELHIMSDQKVRIEKICLSPGNDCK